MNHFIFGQNFKMDFTFNDNQFSLKIFQAKRLPDNFISSSSKRIKN